MSTDLSDDLMEGMHLLRLFGGRQLVEVRLNISPLLSGGVSFDFILALRLTPPGRRRTEGPPQRTALPHKGGAAAAL